LIVASTAGHGEMPLNGQRFLKINMIGHVATSIQFSIFGNGSTLYGDRYNGAAKTIQQHLQKQNATPLDNGLYAGDTAKENPPWTQFDEWYQYIIEKLRVESDSSKQFVRQQSMSTTKSWTAIVSTYHTTKLISCNRAHKQGIQRVVLDIGEQQYNPLSHVSMIVPNEPKVVQRALRTIGLDGKEPIRSIDSRDMTIKEYLTSFVDFDKPFSNIDWVRSWNFSRSQKRLISEVPVRKALQAFTWPWRNSIATESLLKAMPLKTPRMYSAASSQERLRDCDTGDLLELLIQHRKGGAVSDFLETAQPGACIQLRTNPLDEEIEINTPVICFATGSGLAPVLSLLRHRLASTSRPRATGNLTIAGPITLILGFRASDSPIIGEVLREAITCGVIDILLLTPSNDCKVRAQDRIFEDSVRYRIDKKLKHDNASVFVCALPEAADGFARNLSALVGCDIQDSLGDKYIEQVYKPAC
jgi:sulfite reductase alpha subunit-like flavoprotein